MPTYTHTCGKCALTFDDMRSAEFCGNTVPCPTCGGNSPRDWEAEARGHVSAPAECPEQFSDAAGVHPSQIAEAKAKFPHHRFLPDGRMIFKGQREKDRVLRDIGFVEHDRMR